MSGHRQRQVTQLPRLPAEPKPRRGKVPAYLKRRQAHGSAWRPRALQAELAEARRMAQEPCKPQAPPGYRRPGVWKCLLKELSRESLVRREPWPKNAVERKNLKQKSSSTQLLMRHDPSVSALFRAQSTREELQVLSLGGPLCSVRAEKSWHGRELKEEIAKQTKIPQRCSTASKTPRHNLETTSRRC